MASRAVAFGSARSVECSASIAWRYLSDSAFRRDLSCSASSSGIAGIATFTGEAYSAEREDGELKIYLSSVDGFGPDATMDRRTGPFTAADQQRVKEACRKRQRCAYGPQRVPRYVRSNDMSPLGVYRIHVGWR